MATPTSIRLPWRAIVRSVTTRPAPQCMRAACAAPPLNPFTRRYATDTYLDPPLNTSPAAASSQSPAETKSASAASNSESTTTPPPSSSTAPDPESTQERTPRPLNPSKIRLPRAVQAAYLRPLRRHAQYGVPSCDLQLRSYSVRNLEFFTDFCLRAAYYLNLPAYGPIPLPRITERWTVPHGHFIHKKSQENFERKTLRRLIQIKDGDPETVEVWLSFLRKHAYYGIGMKANVWAFEKLGVGKRMDVDMEQMKGVLEPTFRQFAFKKGSPIQDKVLEIINREDFRAASGGTAPMIRTPPEKLPKNEVL